MNPETSPKPAPSRLLVLLPSLIAVILAGLCWVFYTKFQESNALALKSMDMEKAVGEELGARCEKADAKAAALQQQVTMLTKQVSDADATAQSWHEQFNVLSATLAEKARQEAALNVPASPPVTQ